MRRITGTIAIIILVIGLVAGFSLGKLSTTPSTITSTETLTKTTVMVSLSRIYETVKSITTQRITHLITTTVHEFQTNTVTVTTVMTKTTSISEISSVCFSKIDECDDLIISQINSAEKTIHVMIYSFTLDSISDALIEAHRRGVEVKVVIESQNAYQRGSEVEKLKEAGIEVALDSNPYLMHHKVAVIDGRIVITGSYNWSYSAENRNDENLVIIISERIASLYESEFERVWSHAIKL